jgi:FMN-dependent NADH-azoreductase
MHVVAAIYIAPGTRGRAMQLLHVDSSILGEGSVSRALSAQVVARWRERAPGLKVVYRDLAASPLDHVSLEWIGARATPAEARTPEQQRAATEEVIDEFLAADIVVIGAPMYNFGIPSQLKAWIDRLAVAGRTFKYTAEGPIGLAGGKKVIVVSSRGGIYSAGSPTAGFDFQEPYLRALFGFLGITDVEFIRAEGVAVSPVQKVRALAAARQAIATQDVFARAA